MYQERTRQIHLDFHTSEDLPGIGSEFTKAQFQEALKTGHVNLINVFGKCHHSWSYYPTTIGAPHPHLHGDLLGQQIDACHEIGVKAPVYYTVGWSANDAEAHPDWLVRDRDGGFVAPHWPADVTPETAKPTFQWKELCVTGEYHELIATQTEEICRLYEVDGFFFDIYHPQIRCYCERCRAGMAKESIDPDDHDAVEAYRARTILGHARALERIIHSYHSEATLFFNGLTAIERPQNFRYRLHEVGTKNDLEDLPTTWGGYDKFPLRAKIFHREQKPVVAMSGKFHTAWGEFGGFKNPDALRFEAAGMISYGASCNFGDHLHPLGRMDMTTYENIGVAYEYVEKIEAFGIGGLPAATLGFWPSYELEADEGLARMLLEMQMDFDVAAPGDDLSRFDGIVVPSQAGLLEGAEEELAAYLAGGGSLLVLGRGALTSGGSAVRLPLGAELSGEPPFDVDYTLIDPRHLSLPGSRPADKLPQTPFLNYSSALRFSLTGQAQELASLQDPWFSRTYGHYCGHQNTPNRPESVGPAAWQTGNLIVLGHDLDRLYYVHGAKVHRDLLRAALLRLPLNPMLEAALPSAGRVSLLHQKDERRYVAHLLYGSPIERGRCVVIEDLPELHNVAVTMRLPIEPAGLRLEPAGTSLEFEGSWTNGTRRLYELRTTVPSFSCHVALVADYA